MSEKPLSQKPVRYIFIDEVDKYTMTAKIAYRKLELMSGQGALPDGRDVLLAIYYQSIVGPEGLSYLNNIKRRNSLRHAR